MTRIHRTIQKKDLNDPDNHDGVVTHLKPDILEREVKWESAALNMPAILENSAVATGLKKVQFSFQSQRMTMPKNIQTNAQLSSFHMLAR